MTRKPLRIVAVGQCKIPHWKAACAHYSTRISRWRELRLDEVRDGEAALPPPARIAHEAERLLASLRHEKSPAQQIIICLDEIGTPQSSTDFAAWLARLGEQGTPCFVIGGAFGLHESVRAAARHVVSFGPMTLTHELARVVLLEQLYRAECIARRVPYHH